MMVFTDISEYFRIFQSERLNWLKRKRTTLLAVRLTKCHKPTINFAVFVLLCRTGKMTGKFSSIQCGFLPAFRLKSGVNSANALETTKSGPFWRSRKCLLWLDTVPNVTLAIYKSLIFANPSFSRLVLAAFQFPSKNFFRNENFHFSSRRFFLFLKLPMMPRRVQVCRVVVSWIIHVSSVTAVQKPEVTDSNPAIDHKFYVFLDTR